MQHRLPASDSDCQSDQSAEPSATASSRQSQHGLRILIVEDHVQCRATLQRLLELDGHHVETAGDGRRGAETVEFHKPDVALVDIDLPVLDGYQVARRVRSRRENDDVYLIALTGFSRREDEQLAAQAGFDAHLAKPLDYDALETLLIKRAQR
jgi:CheY-like chemotaxis protein